MYLRSKGKNNWKSSFGSQGSSEKKKESPLVKVRLKDLVSEAYWFSARIEAGIGV